MSVDNVKKTIQNNQCKKEEILVSHECNANNVIDTNKETKKTMKQLHICQPLILEWCHSI